MGSMKDRAILVLAVAVAAAIPAAASKVVTTPAVAPDVARARARGIGEASPLTAADVAAARRRDDFAAMQEYRPGYPFWQHVFTLPDHSIAFGSATDGRLLALFPAKGEWTRHAKWTDPSLARVLDGQPLARKVGDRRDQVAELLERASGRSSTTRREAMRSCQTLAASGRSSVNGARSTSASASHPTSVSRR